MAARNDIPEVQRCANLWCTNKKVSASHHFCPACYKKQTSGSKRQKNVVLNPVPRVVVPMSAIPVMTPEEWLYEMQKTHNTPKVSKHRKYVPTDEDYDREDKGCKKIRKPTTHRRRKIRGEE